MRADDRRSLESRWLDLTRRVLPALADARAWPIRLDHCFARVLLDTACDGVWYDHVARRPAYAHADDALLTAAVALGEGLVSGQGDLPAWNAASIARRRARRP